MIKRLAFLLCLLLVIGSHRTNHTFAQTFMAQSPSAQGNSPRKLNILRTGSPPTETLRQYCIGFTTEYAIRLSSLSPDNKIEGTWTVQLNCIPIKNDPSNTWIILIEIEGNGKSHPNGIVEIPINGTLEQAQKAANKFAEHHSKLILEESRKIRNRKTLKASTEVPKPPLGTLALFTYA
jgi:hypothetical protein